MSINLGSIGNDDLEAIISAPITSNKVATATQETQIHAALAALNPAPADVNQLVMSFLIQCADLGTSRLVQFPGSAQGISFAIVKRVVERTCTLRQFAMRYAKIVYSALRSSARAPSNWAAKGFTFDTRFAAFDFFSGVNNSAAVEPPGVMIQPSAQEITMANTNAALSIRASRRPERSTNGMLNAAQQSIGMQRPQIGWYD